MISFAAQTISEPHVAVPRHSTDKDESLEIVAAGQDVSEFPPMQDRTWWRITHALSFTVGGILFLVGTLLCADINLICRKHALC
eukprot:SAG31_NODE_2068_length_6521_cov_6.298194_9_plen_84_part_00